jgi:transcriptional regulator with XRE-family HTH domain
MTTTPIPKGELQARLGERFRTVRRSRGIWLRDMAAKLRCSVNTVRWHESGARMLRVDTIVEAAKLLDVNPSVLLGETELEIEEGIENVVSE